MDALLLTLAQVAVFILDILWWLVIIAVIMSWLIAFNVVNLSNQFVATIYDVLSRLTEPLLRPIRNYMPNLGGIDISPIVLLLIISALRQLSVNALYF